MRPKKLPMAENVPRFPLLALSRLRMEVDGAGVTTLVAGAGCPLSCRFCINKKLLSEKRPEWITPQTLFERTRIDNLYFQATGGGLCFGGGEALLHTDFVAAFREQCGSAWKLTAETALHVPVEAVKKAAGTMDAFIVDIKTMNAEIYRRYTGRDNARVYENLKLLADALPPEKVVLRVPLIPAYNDGADREKSVEILKKMGFTRFDLFTYTIKSES